MVTIERDQMFDVRQQDSKESCEVFDGYLFVSWAKNTLFDRICVMSTVLDKQNDEDDDEEEEEDEDDDDED